MCAQAQVQAGWPTADPIAETVTIRCDLLAGGSLRSTNKAHAFGSKAVQGIKAELPNETLCCQVMRGAGANVRLPVIARAGPEFRV